MSMNISEKTGELLKLMDDVMVPRWHSAMDGMDPRLGKALRTIMTSRRDFDARLFFIVIFGPLKSGKSTLVNTLARQYVSPTRFARESTRRASIVIRGDKSAIQQYFWKNDGDGDNEESRREAFEMVTQYLRGVLKEEELHGVVEMVESGYDQATVDQLLAGPLEIEPLITVIRCPGGELIDNEIAVLDVPGLDGFQTNTDNNPAAFWIIDKSDLLVFTQSSFAPLNNQTSRYLRELYEGSRKPPVLLVQNQIEARHWADPLDQKKETEEQVSVARKEISDLLSLPTETLPAWPINLGKAHDGFFKNLPELMEDSKFENFENQLQDYLEQSRLALHERNCLNEMLGCVMMTESVIGEIMSDLDEGMNEEQVRLALLRQGRESLQQLNYRGKWMDHDLNEFEATSIRPMVDNARTRVRERCGEIASEIRESFPGKSVKGKQINQLIHNSSESLFNKLKSEIFILNDEHHQRIAEIYNGAAEHIESSVISEIEKSLKNLKLPGLSEVENCSVDLLPGFPGRHLHFEIYEERIKLLGFIPWPRKYPRIALEESVTKDLATQWNHAVDELVEKWLQKFRESFVDYAATSRQQVWINQLEKEILNQTTRLHEAKTRVAETSEALDEIQTEITSLKNRLHSHPLHHASSPSLPT